MRQALGQRVSIARVDRGAVMRYGRWVLMHPPCSAALMRPLCVRPECPAFLYPGVRAAGYSSQTHGDCGEAQGEVCEEAQAQAARAPVKVTLLRACALRSGRPAPLPSPSHVLAAPCFPSPFLQCAC